MDDLSGAEDIARQLGIPFPVLYDPAKMVTQLYKVHNPDDSGRAKPATFIVDTEGVITWKYVGSGIGDRPLRIDDPGPATRVRSRSSQICGPPETA